MPPSSQPVLNFRTRADLFSQLAALEAAGLPLDQALSTLRLPAATQPRVAGMRRWISLKLDISDAGLRSGLFTALEAALLRTACNAGSPEPVYRRLADRYAKRARHLAAMKSRMALPLVMFVIALFVQPLPALIGGTLTPDGYVAKCFLPLLVLAGLVRILIQPPSWIRGNGKTSKVGAIDGVLLMTPLFGRSLARRNARDFFESLALLLEAGVPMLQALPVAIDTIHSDHMKNQFAQLTPLIEHGSGFADALRSLSFPGRGHAHALILSGEASGALSQALFRYADAETADLDRFEEQVAEWAPRIVYALVAAWVAYGIIKGAGTMSSLPEELR